MAPSADGQHADVLPTQLSSDPSIGLGPELNDLAQRWSRARRSALCAVLEQPSSDQSEAELLTLAAVKDLRETMRRGFDNSVRLGRGFARNFRPLSFAELPALLAHLAPAAPCLAGTVQPIDKAGWLLTRNGCSCVPSPHQCDWWREVTDGLVVGLTGQVSEQQGDTVVRHTRHRSLGHGDDTCVDVLYADAESPLRYGSIPEHMRAGLDTVARTIARFDSTKKVTFLGLSEGVLLYQLRQHGCGEDGAIDVAHTLERTLARRFPKLALLEISPRSVLHDEQDG
jgi:hypothetical protein